MERKSVEFIVMKNHLRITVLLAVLTLGAGRTFAAPGEKYPQTRTRILSARELANLSSAQRRYAINEIYARHGLLFGDLALRKKFLALSWYRPQPGQTMAQVKAKFSRIERQNVERLSLAREIAGATATKPVVAGSYRSAYAGTDQALKGESFPETRLVKLTRNQVASMSQSQIRGALNEIFARHSYLFGDMALRKQFLGFDWYHPEPKLTMADIRADLDLIERANFELLAANRR